MALTAKNDEHLGVTSAPLILFRDNANWNDVIPIFNDSMEDGAVKISVSAEFQDAYAYLRALLHSNELSERAFQLTSTCIRLNPANYTVWQYRRKILKALDIDPRQELEFSSAVIYENQKNYQVWHHRRQIVDRCEIYSGEFEFINHILLEDEKNYHAWQYRHWLVERFNLFSAAEVQFSTHLLSRNICNNSAWNYRHFVIAKISNNFMNDNYLSQEISFTLNCILELPDNESSWNYLRGILANEDISSTYRRKAFDFINQLMDLNQGQRAHCLFSFLIEYIIEEIEAGVSVELDKIQNIRQHLNCLMNTDSVRRRFWIYRGNYLEHLIKNK